MGGNKGDERGVLQLGVENEEAEGTEVVSGEFHSLSNRDNGHVEGGGENRKDPFVKKVQGNKNGDLKCCSLISRKELPRTKRVKYDFQGRFCAIFFHDLFVYYLVQRWVDLAATWFYRKLVFASIGRRQCPFTSFRTFCINLILF